MPWPVFATPAETYQALLRRAEDDPNVLAFWLGGSRGMGRPTQHSDYDCVFIIAEPAHAAFCAELGLAEPFQMDWRPGIDLAVRTFPMLAAAADWNDVEGRPHRYSYAHLTPIIDKTARAKSLIDAVARIPVDSVPAVIHGALDHALNQAYRALKCRRDGLAQAARLEAAEALAPFLDAAFALHDGRLRPYYKYLAWELETYPLTELPFEPRSLMESLTGMLEPEGWATPSRLLAASQGAFRAAGHGDAFDGWGAKLAWILGSDPTAT